LVTPLGIAAIMGGTDRYRLDALDTLKLSHLVQPAIAGTPVAMCYPFF